METASEIMKQVIPILMSPVNRYLRYLISCTKYVRDMGIKMTELNDARVGVEEHMLQNTSSHLEVPAQVTGWLEDVGKIDAKVENVPSDVGGCFSLKTRHRAGRNASNIIQEIDSLMTRYSLIKWNDRPIPLGKVDSMKANTSTPSMEHNDFQSREVTFTQALKALGPNHKSHMIALCGMGGVGKTTMMERLKKASEEKRMFKYIVVVVIGEKTDSISIQDAVANYLSIELKETIKAARAERLRKWFKDNSDGGKTKFLIILDDVWQSIDLNDIGLSPLPNQGVDFKVLLTSRDRHVCIGMGVEVNSILHVKVLTEVEGQSLFRQFVKGLDGADLDPAFHGIADDIASRCHGLPIIIKTMASSLKGRSKHAWDDALTRLKHHKIRKEVVREVFKIGYDNLQDEETESTFLLCALFPEDFNIPIEELARYGWGLRLFKDVNTINEARNRLNSCTERLRETNLLIESNDVGCIKMHDLVRAFVLHMFLEVEHASIVNHGTMSGWPENFMSGTCKRISLTCTSMSEFPTDLKFPNLSILKLMHGDKRLRFPQDFYEEMKRLQVISYDKMKYPLLPSSLQSSTNLRVLHLHQCRLMFDCSSIGKMVNLEVLSFANSDIEWLPSTIGNLKKLRLLDLTDCDGLHIENGVLKNLVKLEELYMRGGGRKAISLTDENYNELAVRSDNLSALEFEFFHAHPNRMSFEKLQRFKISVGRYLDGDFSKTGHSFENTLQLVSNKGELSTSRMNELFEKMEVLCLSVGDMNDLKDVEMKSSHPPKSSSFYNLRVLVISECAELRYLFTPSVAKTLLNLEHLKVKSCDNMEELIHTGSNGEETISFPKLKLLSLCGLPKLLSLCHNVNMIELQHLTELELKHIPGFTSIYCDNKLEASSLLKEEVLIPKLEKLHISNMENLKEIWTCEFGRTEEIKLREIKVSNCDNIINMFPCNPMSLLHHLEKLEVWHCGSIEVLFDIDVKSIGEIGEGSNSSSLRSIKVETSGKLRDVWRIKGADNSCVLVRGFQAVESIRIMNCKRFRNVFTPTTTNFDLGALMEISITDCGRNVRNDESAESSQEEEQYNDFILKVTPRVNYSISNTVAFPSCLTHSFHNLRKLNLGRYKGVGVVFEIESPTSRELAITAHDNQRRLLPYLEELDIGSMNNMSHVWKCNWNRFFILQKHLESPFHNLTTIHIGYCHNIKYLFSPLMAKLLSNLKKVKLEECDGVEEVVSNRDDEDEENTICTSTSSHTSTDLFPHLDSLTLGRLPNLKCIGGGGAKVGSNDKCFNNTTKTAVFLDQTKFSTEAGGVSWNLCQYPIEIRISSCHALSSVIPCYVGQMEKLQLLEICDCKGIKEVFETQGINYNNNKSGCDDGKGGIPRLNKVTMLPNLKILNISYCGGLMYIFTFSALESLRQLQELTISNCYGLKVIVKEEEDAYGEKQITTTTKASSSSFKEVVVFPRLKSIKLVNLPNLKGFLSGKNEFQWPYLDDVVIKNCPQMTVFTPGGLTAPNLKYIHTSLGKHKVDQHGLNFHVTPAANQQTPFPSSCPATMPWSFHNLIKLRVERNRSIKKIIPSNVLLQLQKLEEIHVSWCGGVEDVFEAIEAGTNRSSGLDESPQTTTLVKLPNLKQVELWYLDCLRYIWKSNQRTVFEFPNLTRVAIRECIRLKQVFTSSMVGSLLQLQELSISKCYQVKEVFSNVVVEEDGEESDGKTNEIVLPRLKSISLDSLPDLKGFWLGKEDLALPLLDTLSITACRRIMVFTKGNLATPELKEIYTNFGSFYVAVEGVNTFIKIKRTEFGKDDEFY